MRHSSIRRFCVLVRTLYVVFVMSIYVLIASTAIAQTNWIDPLGGSYHSTSNWSPANVPNTAGETAKFAIANTYDVSFFAADNVTVDDLLVVVGDVTFVAPGAATYNTDDVIVAGGDLTLFESAAAGHVDLNADTISISQSNSLTIDRGSITTVNDTLTIGDFLTTTHGTVVVQGGSTLNANSVDVEAVIIGMNASTGAGVSTLRVDGSGTAFNTSFGVDVIVGLNGRGALEITGGAVTSLPAANIFLSQSLTASGSTMLIDGGSTVSTFDSISQFFGNTRIGTGNFGDADVQVLGGSLFEPGETVIRGGSTVTIDGTGSTIDATNFSLLDSSDVLVQSEGKLRLTGNGGDAFVGGSTLTVTGAGSRVEAATTVSVAGSSVSNPTRIDVLAGGVIVPAAGFGGQGMEPLMGDHTVLNVSGAGSLFDTGILDMSMSGTTLDASAQLIVDNGGVVMTEDLDANRAHIRLDAGTLRTTGNVLLAGSLSGSVVNSSGEAVLDLLPGSLLDVGGNLVLGNDASLNLFGGELQLADFANLYADDTDPINWNNGTVRVNGNATLTPTASTLLLPTGKIGFGQDLRVVGNVTLQSTVTLDGGTLALEGLDNASLLQLLSGTFEWLDSELIIDTGEALGNTIDLGPNLTIMVGGSLTNQGLITGDGTLSGSLSNNAGATLLIQQGKSIDVIDGTSHSNAGDIQILDGRIDFNGSLTNANGGNIMGRGTLAVGTAFTNQGDLALSNGQTDIFGDVNNTAGGRVIVSGNADVTFWDDVTDAGTLFNVSTGSSATFFGTAGFGISGGGDVFFEADVTPGSSPGLETFGGNVHFGELATLEIEISGTTPGSEFDTLDIAASADLGGTLEVLFLSGFAPEIGDTFEIITAASVVDTFDVETLPDLGGLLWNINYGATNVVLEVVSPFSADFDNDGDVDADDLTKWQGDFGQNGNSDADSDGDSDGADLLAWQQQLGSFVAPTSASSHTVPEPTALGLIFAGIVQSVCKRKLAAA